MEVPVITLHATSHSAWAAVDCTHAVWRKRGGVVEGGLGGGGGGYRVMLQTGGGVRCS